MRPFAVLFGLIATASASRTLNYAVPTSLKAVASNCTLPGQFEVTDFTTQKDTTKNTTTTVCFGFFDPDTKIKTTCERNETSVASGPNGNIYKCDNPYISFVYQTTGVAGLTVVEKACPGSGTTGFEAAGLVQPHLDCSNTAANTAVCHANQTSIHGVFDSLQPSPPSLSRRMFVGGRIGRNRA
ncbi:hypothetical protein F5Y17DRAFT_450544 [Xylariaceae sp. FL0594]|nr:hypothetical protein F5Y17DRAFT_450544 [Xylariaceae sp. FL0594]